MSAGTRAGQAGTRAQLMSVGRRLFAERGFAGTSTEEVVNQAGLTRGALYYHFRNKQDLFRAVFVEVEEHIQQRVTAASMAEGDPGPGLVAGCLAFLDACMDPAVQRIALIDAPSVFGWEAWREAASQNTFGLLAVGLEWAMAAGQIDDQPVAPLAHVLLGALNEGALFIAHSADERAARDQVAAAITRLLTGLRTSTSWSRGSSWPSGPSPCGPTPPWSWPPATRPTLSGTPPTTLVP